MRVLFYSFRILKKMLNECRIYVRLCCIYAFLYIHVCMRICSSLISTKKEFRKKIVFKHHRFEVIKRATESVAKKLEPATDACNRITGRLRDRPGVSQYLFSNAQMMLKHEITAKAIFHDLTFHDLKKTKEI